METPIYKVKNSGFTLIEILVVLIVIAIVLTVALMSFGDFGASRKQQLSTLQLKTSIKSAQLDAILTSTVLGLTVTQTGYRYYHYQYDADNNSASWHPLPHDNLSSSDVFPLGTTLSLITSIPTMKNNPRIYFLPDGTITPFTLILTFKNGQTFKFFLDTDGGIKIEKI